MSLKGHFLCLKGHQDLERYLPNGLEKAKCCTCLQKEQGLPKLLQAGGFTSGKSQKQVLLEAVSGHIEEKNVTGKTQHGFTKGNRQY